MARQIESVRRRFMCAVQNTVDRIETMLQNDSIRLNRRWRSRMPTECALTRKPCSVRVAGSPSSVVVL